MRYVPLTPKVYFGNVVTGSWDTVFGLRDAGAEFLLLIRKDDRIGKLIHSAVANFLAHQRVFLYVVQVFVDMVPQLRYYRDGVERGRHRGVADYNAITTLLVVE